ncbi:unnamed protein product [Strongylus vulgaris]|uniref:Uncharacterized protein n=1 Tax=Strongylus vulgaris TaxID=40348 RepID=A0A3P7J4Z8_STRVU|nr:unnamed protein product [Strongylus vulgaris]
MTSRRVISRESRQCSQIRPFLYVGGLGSLSPRTLCKHLVWLKEMVFGTTERTAGKKKCKITTIIAKNNLNQIK